MNLVKEITNQTISITEFNRGFAGRIFNDVKANGAKVVLKITHLNVFLFLQMIISNSWMN